MVLNLSNHINESPTYLHPNTTNNNTTPSHDNHHDLQYGSSQKREDANVRVSLQNKEMWSKFHHVGTEMIITKAGR